jgi:hypothetical protein
MSTQAKQKLAAHAYPEQDEDHVFQIVRAHLMGYGWEGGPLKPLTYVLTTSEAERQNTVRFCRSVLTSSLIRGVDRA